MDRPMDLLLTRAQTARRLGVSIATVRRMESAELAPVMVEGKHLFRADEVERYARLSDGEVSALAFQAFEQGKTAVEVVVALRQPPERIETLHATWVRMSSRVVVPLPAAGARKHLVDMFGLPVPTGPALICAVEVVCGSEELRQQWAERIARRYPSNSA